MSNTEIHNAVIALTVWERNVQTYPFIEELEKLRAEMNNSFVTDVLGKARTNLLTEKQGAALSNCLNGWAGRAERLEMMGGSVHVGQIGESIVINDAKVIFTKDLFNKFGESRLVKFLADGNVITTFSSAKWAWLTNEGDVLNFTAKVKKHGEYDGVLDTNVNYLKVL